MINYRRVYLVPSMAIAIIRLTCFIFCCATFQSPVCVLRPERDGSCGNIGNRIVIRGKGKPGAGLFQFKSHLWNAFYETPFSCCYLGFKFIPFLSPGRFAHSLRVAYQLKARRIFFILPPPPPPVSEKKSFLFRSFVQELRHKRWL